MGRSGVYWLCVLGDVGEDGFVDCGVLAPVLALVPRRKRERGLIMTSSSSSSSFSSSATFPARPISDKRPGEGGAGRRAVRSLSTLPSRDMGGRKPLLELERLLLWR